MIRFLLRKFFYDLWDNLFKVILLNMGFLGIVALALTAPSLPVFYPPLSLAVFVVIVFAAFVYVCAAARSLKEASDYRSFGAGDFFAALKPACRSGLVLGCLFFAEFFLIRFAIPFYLALGLAGIVFAAVCFWTAVILAAAFQFLPAVFARLEKRPLKALKKCLGFFFDNIPFSFFSLFFTVVLSLPVIFFPAFPLLYLDEALRLRLLKYDRPSACETGGATEAEDTGKAVFAGGKKSRKIPWKEILAGEMEKTGKRSWKDFVFPWR
jgi:hypothetical protein